MKNKHKQLDVDSIGAQQQPITKEEELLISSFIQFRKEKSRSQSIRKKKAGTSLKTYQPS